MNLLQIVDKQIISWKHNLIILRPNSSNSILRRYPVLSLDKNDILKINIILTSSTNINFSKKVERTKPTRGSLEKKTTVSPPGGWISPLPTACLSFKALLLILLELLRRRICRKYNLGFLRRCRINWIKTTNKTLKQETLMLMNTRELLLRKRKCI